MTHTASIYTGLFSPEIFLSGHCVPPGIYRDIFSGSKVTQSGDTCLPCQEHGSPAVYVRLTRIGMPHPVTKQIISHEFAPSEGKLGQ
jgi:hypothetical protein